MNIEGLKMRRKVLRRIGTKYVNWLKDELSKNEPDKGFLEDKLNTLKEIVRELKDLDRKILDLLAHQDVSVDELVADLDICEEYYDEIITLERVINKSLENNNVYPVNNSCEDKLGDSVDKENRYELTKPKIKEAFEGISEMAPKNELIKEGDDISPNSIPIPKNLITEISSVPEIPDQSVCIISCKDYLSSDMNVKGLFESQVDSQCEIKDKNEINPFFYEERKSDSEMHILLPIEYDSLDQHPDKLCCEPCFETDHSENFECDGSRSEPIPRKELSDFSSFTSQELAKVGEFPKMIRPRWENPHLQRKTPQTDHVNRDCFVINELDKELNASNHRLKYDISVFSLLNNIVIDSFISKAKGTFFVEDFAGLPKVKLKLIFAEN